MSFSNSKPLEPNCCVWFQAHPLKRGDPPLGSQRGPFTPKGQFTHRRHDTTVCDTTRLFALYTIKWTSSHICSTTMSCRHDKKLLHQKSLWKRFLSCVAATVSRKLLKKTVSIGISPGFINL